ncbi:MAG: CocE/NonD family hydrolase [Myxococcota bacterium]|nr:CocE/NonD family hydrolase [Myxococcota bacterium]
MIFLISQTFFLGCADTTKQMDSAEEITVPDRPADFNISAGVESVTVLDATPGAALTLYNSNDERLVTIIADEWGQAHFAYLPFTYETVNPNNFETISLENGSVLPSGEGYYIQNDESENQNWSGKFTVLDVNDIPDVSLYEKQILDGIHHSLITGTDGDVLDGFQYIEMRDGVLLSAMIRFPDPLMYGEGPYPTVIEYSGYSPSKPQRMDGGTTIANALGYATVSVNMRGSGCSGGIFDVFNRAQHADGYDIVETVARQEWVLNNQVGMVGLSYPGISQLYVASTNPPSLAAVAPQSTIADAWEMQWPGGIYNKGFTRSWVERREHEAQLGGASWVIDMIELGDTICEENLRLSHHSIDFETFLRGLPMRPNDADARDLNRLVEQVALPVYVGGVFQDEQTGGQFAAFLDRFHSTDTLKIQLSNGRHPDGFSPNSVMRWYEFLEFYVSERIPSVNPAIRVFANEFGNAFGMEDTELPADRFDDYNSFEDALAAYEAEPTIRLLFENGAGSDVVGEPVARYETTYDQWPPNEAQPLQWYLGDTSLSEAADNTSAIDLWTFDPEASDTNFFGESGYHTMRLMWDIDWTYFSEGYVSSYLTDVFEESQIVSGPGILDLWIRSPVDDVVIQATLTEIRPDGNEIYVQGGWIRVGHNGAEDDKLRLLLEYNTDNFTPVRVGEWIKTQIQIPSFAHPFRAGSQLRLAISSPGRDHGTWQFETPVYDSNPTFELGRGGDLASTLRLSTLPDITIPVDYPDCEALRGQPCRVYQPTPNVHAE